MLLVAVRLKQGLQEGIGEEWLRWESPKVQEIVSGEKRERRRRKRIKMRQGSKVRVEASIVDLTRDRQNLVVGTETEGVKRERANETNVTATSATSCLLWRKQVMTELMTMDTVKGMRE